MYNIFVHNNSLFTHFFLLIIFRSGPLISHFNKVRCPLWLSRQQIEDITMDKSDSEFDILSKWLIKQLPCLTCHEIQQYVNKLIEDGWNNVDFIEDKLDGEKCLYFMLAAHKQVLMKRLNEIRERRADG